MILRDYQMDCLREIGRAGPGKWLVQMATGLGKTATFAHLQRPGRMLILAHREELVYQPMRYFTCPVGIEMASSRSHGEPVVIASTQSMINRLEQFNPTEFDTVVIDEAHHYSAKTFFKVATHFTPRLRLGFTATPNRADNVRLDTLFDRIIFERDIRFGIERGWLSPVKCFRIKIDRDISKVARCMGDFVIGDLEKMLNIESAHQGIKEALDKYGRGHALVFCISIAHAEDLAKYLGGVCVVGTTPNRDQILARFKAGQIPVLTTVQVLTEGVDLPIADTIAMARPTLSATLYTQMAGRGFRPHPGKEACVLLDFVYNSGRHSLQTAPSLLGVDLEDVSDKYLEDLKDLDLLDLPEYAEGKADCPESWIKSVRQIELFEGRSGYNLHDVNYVIHPDGWMVCPLTDDQWVATMPVDHIGHTRIVTSNGITSTERPAQQAFDDIFRILCSKWAATSALWSIKAIKRWGKDLASEDQLRYCRGLLQRTAFASFSLEGLSKMEVSSLINRVKFRSLNPNRAKSRWCYDANRAR